MNAPELLAALIAATERMEAVAARIPVENRAKGVSQATHVAHMAGHLAQHAKIARAVITEAMKSKPASLPRSETLLYGRKIDSQEWEETLLSTNPARFDEIQLLAAKDGFGHFRVTTIDLTKRPDFAATVRRK